MVSRVKLKLLKKAWDVLDPYVWESSRYGRQWDDAETVYAETSGEAKRQCSHYDSYLDIRCRRNKSHDLVEYEGKENKRGKVLYMIEHNKVEDVRKKALEALPDNELFYVQDSRSYVGNSVLWWGLNNKGYTTELNKAQKYTKEEVIKQFSSSRDSDVIWVASHVESLIRTHVDMQYLESKFRVR